MRAHITDEVEDRDVWAVNLIERSALPEQLKVGWFWATWPDRVELIFPVASDESKIQHLTAAVESVMGTARHLVSKPEITVAEEINDA